VGDDRKGKEMTELTPREILDAIRRGLEETARRLAGKKPEQAPEKPRQAASIAGEQSSRAQRPT
jgi:hypothetical protein